MELADISQTQPDLSLWGLVTTAIGVAAVAFVKAVLWLDARQQSAAQAALKANQDGAQAALLASEKTKAELTVRIEHLETQVSRLQNSHASARKYLVMGVYAAAQIPTPDDATKLARSELVKHLQDALAALD